MNWFYTHTQTHTHTHTHTHTLTHTHTHTHKHTHKHTHTHTHTHSHTHTHTHTQTHTHTLTLSVWHSAPQGAWHQTSPSPAVEHFETVSCAAARPASCLQHGIGPHGLRPPAMPPLPGPQR